MAQQPPPPAAQETQPNITIDSKPATENQNKKTTEEQATEALKEIQENVGQIAELTIEEDNLVKELFNFLLKILKPFAKTLEISPSSLPEDYSKRTNKAYLYIDGQLALVFNSGEAEILNLTEEENRQILVDISGEIMKKLTIIINEHKAKIEKRVKFLMQITKELQKVAEVFSEDLTKQ